MRIRTLLLLIFGTLLALQAGLTAIAYRMEHLQETTALAQARRMESWKLAMELRSSSDELTRMARTFVVTGDPVYEQYFHDILAIRSGEKARPEGYSGIYWDFIAAARTPVVSSGAPISLDAMMRALDFSAAEFEALRQAQDRSEALAKLEVVAMNAVKGRFADQSGGFTVEGKPDLEMARSIMHGQEYHRAKAEIMRPIAEFFQMLDARTAREVDAARAAARQGARLTLGITVAGAVFIVVAFLLLMRWMLRPIQQMIERLRDIAEGDGDLTRRIDEDRGTELGELAHWFNRFVVVVWGVVREVAGTAEGVAAAATEIAATAREQDAAVQRLGSSTGRVTEALRDISDRGRTLASTVAAINESAQSSAQVADAGRSGLREMESTMQGLEAAARSVADKFETLQDRTEGIGGIAQAMTKVAGQTNLLSVNAAIEAVKAGNHGAGFQTVARGVRRLAEQSAEKSLSIETDVGAMRAAVADGRAEIARFGETVHGVADRVEQVADQFGRIIEQVQGVTGQFQSVAAGAEQQAAGIRQIGETMRALDADAERSRESMREFVRTAELLRDSTVALRGQIARFRIDAAIS